MKDISKLLLQFTGLGLLFLFSYTSINVIQAEYNYKNYQNVLGEYDQDFLNFLGEKSREIRNYRLFQEGFSEKLKETLSQKSKLKIQSMSTTVRGEFILIKVHYSYVDLSFIPRNIYREFLFDTDGKIVK